MLEAAFAPLFDAAQVRLAQFGQAVLSREARGLDTQAEEAALLDLRFGLEAIAQLLPGADQDAVIGYLIERYGLLRVGTDPFLRPLLPPVPVGGATVRRYVLSINARAIVANSTLIGVGAALVPTPVII